MQFSHYRIALLNQNDTASFLSILRKNQERLEFFAGILSKTNTLEETQKYMADVVQKTKDKFYFPFAVHDNLTNEIIGFVDIKNIDWSIPKAELGCFIDEQYAKKGISFQALSLVIDFAFKELQISKLFLRTHPKNTAAQKLAESCGFEIEGTIRRDYKTSKGEVVDLLYYGKINS